MRVSRLVLLGCVFLAAAALAGTPAHAVTFSTRANYLVPPTNVPHGLQDVASGDFNGDSDPDLALAHQDANKISVLLGSTAGTFSAPTDFALFSGANPLSVAVGNFNGDSDPDLAVANEGSGAVPGGVSVLLGAPGGGFTGPTNFGAGASPQSVAVGNFDGDSDPDLAVANLGSNDVSILLGGAGGSFSAPTNFVVGAGPIAVAVGQFNGDSDPDLAVANDLSNDVSILLGAAGGSFTAMPTNIAVGSAPISIEVGEFNGDSDPDLAVANELTSDVSVLLGSTGGTFTGPNNFTVGSLPDAVAVGNLNGGSDLDLAVANQGSDNISLLFGGTGGSFTGPTNFTAGDGPSSIAVNDFNGDSYPDLAVTNEISNDVSILLATPPETTIQSGPPGLTNDPTPTFAFSSNDPSSTFQCQLNGGSFFACTSPYTTASLPDGTHTFEVRATDDAARTDLSPATWTFSIDTVPPPVPTLSATDPGSPANHNSPQVKGTAAANTSVALYKAATTSDCTPVNLLATGASADFASTGIAVPVADNSTTRFRATTTDAAGNTSACSTSSIVYVEVSPPPAPPPGGIPGPPAGAPAPVGGPVPAGSGASPDTSAPLMTVATKPVKLDSSGVVVLSLSCPASEAGCEGILSLETFGAVRVRTVAGGRVRSRRQKVKLGKGAFQLGGGRKGAVRLRLSKKNQRVVRKLRSVRVLVIVEARDRAGNRQTTRKPLTLKAGKLRKR
jgi:predicted NUDIX family NTP pyrophosphohydrolase